MAEEMFEGSLRLLLGTDATVLFLPAGSERKKKSVPETTLGPREGGGGGGGSGLSVCFILKKQLEVVVFFIIKAGVGLQTLTQ